MPESREDIDMVEGIDKVKDLWTFGAYFIANNAKIAFGVVVVIILQLYVFQPQLDSKSLELDMMRKEHERMIDALTEQEDKLERSVDHLERAVQLFDIKVSRSMFQPITEGPE